ncbi:DUF2487 family protein [Cohnella thailandensis]|uniref:DUF2487 family protein n=1 Tax=Cohnella thailandensis TaxID=557557 RepID=A0A841SXL4_9BACL|nr:DUF2487 family protein [Cohnella thailandensis]MBB6635366.1 DUF2487 family protein [Cohnella thailandensis]MBP1974745.1 hypothetical protein [Cohnella thailandensis]
MKFSELTSDQWYDLLPYLDTCLIPVSGLVGDEPPHEAAERIAETGDWLQPLETAFRGRTVTMPAYHYINVAEKAEIERIGAICGRVKQLGFKYIVVVSGRADWAEAPAGADLILKPEESGMQPDTNKLRQAITELWKQEGRSR